MKRIICLFLALWLLLAAPAVSATELPDDPFFWQYRGECQLCDRTYEAAGPDNVAEIYRSPVSTAVVTRVKNGLEIRISYTWEDANGFLWGYTEEDGGWIPMDYLLLLYDHRCFLEEFPDRITETAGTLDLSEVRLWAYPGSDRSELLEAEEIVEYTHAFTDDAGREWVFVPYLMGVRDTWVCLDDPAGDYRTLYENSQPQRVTHPVKMETELPEISAPFISLNGILAAVSTIGVLTIGFFWMTRKKK